MRLLPTVLVSLCFSFALYAQQASTRLAGMGNVSIAVPDPESEAFSNPAKATRMKGILVRANPSYLRFSKSQDFSSSSGTPSYVNSSKSSNDYTLSNALLPFDALLSLNPFYVGGSFSYLANSSESSYDYQYSYPGSISTSKSKVESSPSGTSYGLLVALDVGVIALGAGVSFSQGSSDDKNFYSDAYTNNPPTVNESASKSESDVKIYRVGLLYGSTDAVEVSFLGSMQPQTSEQKFTRLVYSGQPQPDLPTYLSDGTDYNLLGEVRCRLTDQILAGVRFTFSSSKVDESRKSTWYDALTLQGVYQERKIAVVEVSAYQFGGGLSWQISSGGIIAAEFVLAPATNSTRDFYTVDGTKSDGSPYRRGEISLEEEYKILSQIVRLGSEFSVGPDITLRLGAEVNWLSSDRSSKYTYDFSRISSNGMTGISFTGVGGFSYNIASLRFDYTLMFLSQPIPVSYFSPYLYYAQDLYLRHTLTAVLQL